MIVKSEKEKILIRTLPGRIASKMGKLGGRPKKLTEQEIKLAIDLYNDRKNSIGNICKILRISKPSLYAYIRCRHKRKIEYYKNKIA